MIRKLRLKFVAVCMAMVMAVLAVVLFALYISLQQNVEDLSRQVLRRVIQEDPGFRRGAPEVGVNIGGDRLLLPYFTVSVWPGESGTFSAFVTGGTYADLENTEALEAILRDCLSQDRPEGIIEPYRLRFIVQNNGIYWKLAFVDMSMEEAMLQKMMWSYLTIAAAACTLLLGVSILLSGWATRPVERAWRQQRQFLSDASHELKTPLTVILSNAELLEEATLEERPARWADNITSEAKQMKSLVEEMLTLARADNMTQVLQFSEFSLTELVTDCALAFEPVAYEAGKVLHYTIEEGITVQGDPDRLRRLAAVLLDNAIKYGAPGGEIVMELQKMEKQVRLTVSNPGPAIPPEQLRRLFERFYRADASRGEQSGFGLGLPIAAAIAAEHKGTLRAESDSVSTRFIFQMPVRNH